MTMPPAPSKPSKRSLSRFRYWARDSFLGLEAVSGFAVVSRRAVVSRCAVVSWARADTARQRADPRLIHRRNHCPWIVCLEDRPVVLARARAADRSRLAHADSVSVPESAQRERLDMSVDATVDIHLKIGGVQDLAIRRAEHIPNLVAAEFVIILIRYQCQRGDAARRGRTIRDDGLDRAERARVAVEILLEQGLELRPAEGAGPPELRRSLTIVLTAAAGDEVTHGPQVWQIAFPPDLRCGRRHAAARGEVRCVDDAAIVVNDLARGRLH